MAALPVDGDVADLGGAVPARLLRGCFPSAALCLVIVVPAAPLSPAEAVRRAAAGRGAFWLASPGADGDIDVAIDCVGCDPIRVLQGADVDELEVAVAEERRRWSASSAPAGAATAG